MSPMVFHQCHRRNLCLADSSILESNESNGIPSMSSSSSSLPSSWSKMSHFEVTACAWTSSGSTVSHLDGTNPAGICLAEELETLFLDDGVWTSRGIPSTSESSSVASLSSWPPLLSFGSSAFSMVETKPKKIFCILIKKSCGYSAQSSHARKHCITRCLKASARIRDSMFE